MADYSKIYQNSERHKPLKRFLYSVKTFYKFNHSSPPRTGKSLTKYDSAKFNDHTITKYLPSIESFNLPYTPEFSPLRKPPHKNKIRYSKYKTKIPVDRSFLSMWNGIIRNTCKSHYYSLSQKPARPRECNSGNNYLNGADRLYYQYLNVPKEPKIKKLDHLTFNTLDVYNHEKFDKIKSIKKNITHSEAAWNEFQELTGVDGYHYKYYTQKAFNISKYNKPLLLRKLTVKNADITKKEGVTWETNYHKALRRMLSFHLFRLYYNKDFEAIKSLVMRCGNKLNGFKWNNEIKNNFEKARSQVKNNKMKNGIGLTGTNINLKNPWIPNNFRFCEDRETPLLYPILPPWKREKCTFSINRKRGISLVPWFDGHPTYNDDNQNKSTWWERKANYKDDYKPVPLEKSNIIYPYSLIIEKNKPYLYSYVANNGYY